MGQGRGRGSERGRGPHLQPAPLPSLLFFFKQKEVNETSRNIKRLFSQEYAHSDRREELLENLN